MTEEVALHFLSEHVNFHAAPAALADLNLNRLHLTNIEPFTQPSLEFITNRVVIALEHFKSSERNISFSTVKWLKTLSTQCSQMSDSLLTSNVLTTIKKYKLLSKMKNANEPVDFLKKQFPEESNSIFAESSESSVITTEMSEVITPQSCSQCDKLESKVKQEECEINRLVKEMKALSARENILRGELDGNTTILKELQKEKQDLEVLAAEDKSLISCLKKEVRKLGSENKKLQEEITHITNTKLYYQRNIECKKEIKKLQSQISEMSDQNERLREELQAENDGNEKLRQKIKNEQQMKSKLKKERDSAKDKIERCLYSLNTLEEEKELNLKKKFNAYTHNIRELYMSLQGETSIVPAQTSKAVQLVAKHLFDKDIPLQALPCRKQPLISWMRRTILRSSK